MMNDTQISDAIKDLIEQIDVLDANLHREHLEFIDVSVKGYVLAAWIRLNQAQECIDARIAQKNYTIRRRNNAVSVVPGRS